MNGLTYGDNLNVGAQNSGRILGTNARLAPESIPCGLCRSAVQQKSTDAYSQKLCGYPSPRLSKT